VSSFSSDWTQCFCIWAMGIQYVPTGRTLARAARPYGRKSGTESGAVSR
jgi:hypothetical protein